ncbi:MAG: hypothetical protein WC530_08760 [Candidatus Omnitrophota bacterium]|jgi:hypothetical protein
MSFSKRQGIEPASKALQLGSMDDELRTCLWNALTERCWDRFITDQDMGYCGVFSSLCGELWKHYFKWPMDSIPDCTDRALEKLRGYFFKAPWNKVYDFIEFMASVVKDEQFIEQCNFYLERECAGYRFVDKKITPITDPVELGEIDAAMQLSDEWKPIKQHMQTALEMLSDRKNPDYRNSIKESISAVEAVCGKIAGKPGATLGDALKILEKKGNVEMHAAFRQAFDKLYGYTSDAEGIRHALLEESNLGFEDAKFMLVVCSAFINFVIAKMK